MTAAHVDRILARPDSELVEAIAEPMEDQWFERKSGRIDSKTLAMTLVAFANADGGVVIVGVHDGQLDGLSADKENELRQTALDRTVPPVRAHCEARDVPGGRLLVIRVDPGEVVHTLTDGTCYLRIGDESRKLTLAQQRELGFDRGAGPYDASSTDLTIADLDPLQLEAYTEAIGAESIQGMMRARDLLTRDGKVTVAAALLFAERPQIEFSSAHVRVMKYGRDERGVGGDMSLEVDERIDGSLPAQIMQTAELVEELMPKWEQLAPSGLFERSSRIPRDAWLEGLVNAVVHRSYSMMGDHVRVEIFPNRVEITSPGRFPGLANSQKPLAISRYARNPRIARVCSDLGITRELGEGIKRMFREMRRRGLTDPIYTQGSAAVTLVLSATDSVSREVLARLPLTARHLLDELRKSGRPLGTGQLAELASVARPTAKRSLQALEREGLVVWDGSSPRDPRAVWRLV